MFKILNGYENIDSNFFFEIKESKITRGHNYTLVKKQSRLDVRKYSFSQRTSLQNAPKTSALQRPIKTKNPVITASERRSLDLTRFNKIATQGAPQMAVDKEANSLSRVYSYYSKFILCLFYM